MKKPPKIILSSKVEEKEEVEQYYTITKEDEEFLKKAIQTGAPVSFADVFMWMAVARECGCGLEGANARLKQPFNTFVKTIRELQQGIISVPAGSLKDILDKH